MDIILYNRFDISIGPPHTLEQKILRLYQTTHREKTCTRCYKRFCMKVEEHLNRLIFNGYKSIKLMEKKKKIKDPALLIRASK